VQIGGKATVFAPVYGPPFVRDLDGNRRYATIEDFRNFVKLAYMAPSMHSFGRHRLRAGRHAGQQAPSRHGLFAHIKSPTSRSWAR
jgi:trimethylamine:corrinoid methyltransferase-like protein